MREVSIGGFAVADAGQAGVLQYLLDRFRLGKQSIAYALHVGGLACRGDQPVKDAYSRATLTYADGVSIVALGRLAGASQMGRAPTTDLGHDLISVFGTSLDRPVRVGLLGGPPGLADRAARAIEQRHGADVCFTADGYAGAETAAQDLARLPDEVDLLFVGLGCPREMLWVDSHPDLPARTIVTCGGWFGFLAGDESRAPMAVQRSGLEWVWRVAQQPRSKARRYLIGLQDCLVVALRISCRRLSRPSRRDP